jgi:hypothetical protein
MSQTPIEPALIKGNQLLLTFDGGANTYAQVTKATLDFEEADGDLTTFKSASEGGESQPSLSVTVTQSTDPASLCMQLWDNPGKTVPFVYAPHGNATPTPAQPHFTGFVQIPVTRPTIGGEAAKNGKGNTSDVKLLVCTADGGTPGDVNKVTGATPSWANTGNDDQD